MIRRTFDAAFLNGVANHPEVRPWLAGEGVLDLAPVIANPANFALISEFGGFVLIRHEPGVYEVHSMFLPGNGGHPVKAMLAAQDWMFTRTDCMSVVSRVPANNSAAKGFAITGGLRTIFTRNDAALGACEYTELGIMDWAMRTAALVAHGKRFHAIAENATQAAGLPEHPDDPAHEQAAGAALLMVERGQAAKGVAFYNRWARLAGYPVIRLLSEAPVTVDMSSDGATFAMGMGINGMEVLICQ